MMHRLEKKASKYGTDRIEERFMPQRPLMARELEMKPPTYRDGVAGATDEIHPCIAKNSVEQSRGQWLP